MNKVAIESDICLGIYGTFGKLTSAMAGIQEMKVEVIFSSTFDSLDILPDVKTHLL